MKLVNIYNKKLNLFLILLFVIFCFDFSRSSELSKIIFLKIDLDQSMNYNNIFNKNNIYAFFEKNINNIVSSKNIKNSNKDEEQSILV